MKLKTGLLLSILFLSTILSVPRLTAQTTTTPIETLHIAFWPDFDEPAVLVLVTGSLPAETALPVQVTIPIPANADINAVARVNSDVGMADTEYEVDGDSLTLTTPDPQFRVEYYVPYRDEGGWRNYDFVWNSNNDVQELTAEIQQPANAASLLTEPAASTVVTNPSDGLTYHGFAPQIVDAGTPYEISFRYNATGSGLTIEQQEPVPDLGTAPESSATQQNPTINWLYILVGFVLLLLVAVITWFAATKFSNQSSRKPRKSQKPRKPGPRTRTANSSTSSSEQARFCHNCGTRAETGDRFCRTCGTELKRP